MTAHPGAVPLAFDDLGPPGTDVVLLIHGHPFNRSMWRPQLTAITAMGWRVIAPDLRGYGESFAAGAPSFEQFGADLVGLLDALGVQQVVVGGLSMGGQIAMDVCRQAPARVRGLLLAATFPHSESPEGKARRFAMAERLIAEGMAGYAAEVLPRMIGAKCLKETPEVGQSVLSMMRATDPQGAAAALRARAQRQPYEPVLAQFKRPSTVIVGDADAFTTREDAETMASLLSDCELHWMPEVGHMPNLERPDEFNAALLRLMERVSADSL